MLYVAFRLASRAVRPCTQLLDKLRICHVNSPVPIHVSGVRGRYGYSSKSFQNGKHVIAVNIPIAINVTTPTTLRSHRNTVRHRTLPYPSMHRISAQSALKEIAKGRLAARVSEPDSGDTNVRPTGHFEAYDLINRRRPRLCSSRPNKQVFVPVHTRANLWA